MTATFNEGVVSCLVGMGVLFCPLLNEAAPPKFERSLDTCVLSSFATHDPSVIRPLAAKSDPSNLFTTVRDSKGEIRPVYRVDGHVHSSDHSGNRSSLTDIRRTAERRKLDALFLTDHMGIKKWPEINARQLDRGPSPRIFLGVEAGSANGHLGLWGANSKWTGKRIRSFRDLIQYYAKTQPQALRILNHPGWWPVGGRHYRRRNFRDRTSRPKLQAVEIFNGRSLLRFSTLRIVKRWETFLLSGLKVPLVAGSDAHSFEDVATVMTAVAARALTPAGIIDGVKGGKTYVTDDASLAFYASEHSIGETIRVASNETGLPVRVFVSSRRGGRLSLFLGKRIIAQQEISSGCHGFETIAALSTLKADSYLRIQLVRKERKPAYYSSILKEQVPSALQDYIGMMSSPIFLDLEPYDDHWESIP